MTAFDLAQDAIFGDGNLGEGVIYTPAGGVAIALRAVVVQLQQAPVGVFGAPANVTRFDIRRADLAQPTEGDTVAWRGRNWRVTSFDSNPAGTIWQLSMGRPS